MDALPEGAIVGERYRVIGPLGAGGMGAVYCVEHTMMSKRLALKLLRPELSTDASVTERFEREARSAARLDHAKIVRITDFGKAADGSLFMVMELVDGRALSDHLKDGRVSIERALDLVDQTLEALAHAHKHDVVHRDIKPANIMLAEGTQVKLVDFGIAKITAREGPDTNLTQMGMVVGTPRYMSPEQATGEPVDSRTDLYSVGVLLYELLTGRAPFDGASSVEILTKHLTAAVPPLTLERTPPQQKAALDGLVARALAKKRDDRFQTADDFRAAITAVRNGTAPLKPGPGPDRSKKTRIITIAAAASIALIALVLLLRPTEPSLLDQGEQALARGDLPSARAIALQALAKDPNDARAHLLEGAIALAEGKPDAALTAFKGAAAKDRKLASDPIVMNAVRAQVLADSKHAEGYLTLLAEEGDSKAIPTLVDLAKTAKRALLRKTAYSGLERLGDIGDIDRFAWLTKELEASQPCTARKWYVDRLITMDDERSVPVLKKELGRKGGFLNLRSESDCMAADIRAHLKALE